MPEPSPKPRPLPRPTHLTKPFWEAAKRGELALQYDAEAKSFQFWPRSTGIKSGSTNLEWRTASGLGTIYSYTVTHIPMPGFEGRGLYSIGLIDLDEGVRIIANLVDVKPEDVKIGMRVRVVFERLSDDISYFAFAPLSKSA